MIDIHCHLLPGLDDGAETIENSKAIAKQLSHAGFDTIIATPHVIEGREMLIPERIIEATNKLNETLKENEMPLTVLPGAENYIFPEMAKWLAEGKLLTLGNRGQQILVELPRLEIPHYTDQVFFDLQVAGVTPVLAHPERYKGLMEDPGKLISWAEKGVLFQIDLRSLSGRYGPEAERFCWAMLEGHFVHFIGSDAHRVATSTDAYQYELERIKESMDPSYFNAISRDHPQKVLDGNMFQSTMEYNVDAFKNNLRIKPVRGNFFSWIKKVIR